MQLAGQKRDQAQHKLERLENRADYLQKGDRAKRTHHLCNIGGTVEHFIPAMKEMDKAAIYLLFERLIGLLRMADYRRNNNPVYDKPNQIKFKKSREKYAAQHDQELLLFYMVQRKLKPYLAEGSKPPA